MTGRNADERLAIWREIQNMEQLRNEAIDTISDIEDDDEYDQAFDAIWAKYDTSALANKMYYLEYPESRNSWYKDFVKSFGICQNKRISHKQGNIFAKYCEKNHYDEWGRGSKYYGRVENLGIECWVFSERESAYVSIIELM